MKTCFAILVAVVASAQAGFLSGGLYAAPQAYSYNYAPTYVATPVVKTIAVASAPAVKVIPYPTVVRTVNTPPIRATLVQQAPIYKTVAVARTPIVKAVPVIRTVVPVAPVRYVAPTYYPAVYPYAPYAANYAWGGPLYFKK